MNKSAKEPRTRMNTNAVNALWTGLVLLLVLCIPGCGGGGEQSGPTTPSAQVNGVWAVTFDYGNGLVAKQNITIVQSGNDLTLTADPPDLYGPLPGNTPIKGYVAGNGIFASWDKTWDTCRYSSRLETTVTFNNFSGVLYWSRNAYGVGYCPAAINRFSVRGSL